MGLSLIYFADAGQAPSGHIPVSSYAPPPAQFGPQAHVRPQVRHNLCRSSKLCLLLQRRLGLYNQSHSEEPPMRKQFTSHLEVEQAED